MHIKTICKAHKSMMDKLPGHKDAQCVCFQYRMISLVRTSLFQATTIRMTRGPLKMQTVSADVLGMP